MDVVHHEVSRPRCKGEKRVSFPIVGLPIHLKGLRERNMLTLRAQNAHDPTQALIKLVEH